MANWRLARGLSKLRQQINDRWPSRNKVSDGAIGDAAHASRSSDHNPWYIVSGIGVVTAIDVTHDFENGPDGVVLSEALTHDSRTKYVIFAGRIWKARTGHWEPYTGPNKHFHHVHLSIKPEACDDERVWLLQVAPVLQAATKTYPTLKRGDRGLAVKDLQQHLHLDSDGIFGPATEAKVKLLQKAHGLAETGVVNEATWSALLGADD